ACRCREDPGTPALADSRSAALADSRSAFGRLDPDALDGVAGLEAAVQALRADRGAPAGERRPAVGLAPAAGDGALPTEAGLLTHTGSLEAPLNQSRTARPSSAASLGPSEEGGGPPPAESPASWGNVLRKQFGGGAGASGAGRAAAEALAATGSSQRSSAGSEAGGERPLAGRPGLGGSRGSSAGRSWGGAEQFGGQPGLGDSRGSSAG
ncbi:unnamed protein product, partial [Prorocentrum cordatum]